MADLNKVIRTGTAGHKHIDSRAKWTTIERSNSAGPDKPHDHGVDLSGFVSMAEFEMLRARVEDLETTVPETPPTEPAPTPPPAGLDVPIGSFQAMVTGAVDGQTLLPVPGTHGLGTSGNPVVLRASGVSIIAKAPTPLVRAGGRPNGLWITGSEDIVVRGLAFGGTDPGLYDDDQGSALMELDGQAPVVNTLVEDLRFDLPSGASKRQHGQYFRDTVAGYTGRRVKFYANGSLARGVHGYHSNPTRSHDIIFEDYEFYGFYDAVLFWLACDRLTFRRCTFVGTRNVDIRVKTGGLVTVEGCKGSKGILLDTPTASETAAGWGMSTLVDGSGNDWNWAP